MAWCPTPHNKKERMKGRKGGREGWRGRASTQVPVKPLEFQVCGRLRWRITGARDLRPACNLRV